MGGKPLPMIDFACWTAVASKSLEAPHGCEARRAHRAHQSIPQPSKTFLSAMSSLLPLD